MEVFRPWQDLRGSLPIRPAAAIFLWTLIQEEPMDKTCRMPLS